MMESLEGKRRKTSYLEYEGEIAKIKRALDSIKDTKDTERTKIIRNEYEKCEERS